MGDFVPIIPVGCLCSNAFLLSVHYTTFFVFAYISIAQVAIGPDLGRPASVHMLFELSSKQSPFRTRNNYLLLFV